MKNNTLGVVGECYDSEFAGLFLGVEWSMEQSLRGRRKGGAKRASRWLF